MEALKLCRQWAASFTHERRKGAPLTKEVPVAADPSPRRACLLGAIVGHIGDGIAGAFAAVSLRAGGPSIARGPTSRIEYGAGSKALEKTTKVLDSPCDRHLSHARDGAGKKKTPVPF